VTGARSDYGLLRPVMQRLQGDPEVEFQLAVTGTHLSPEFGLTVEDIERDGLVITRRIEMLLSSDSCVGLSKSLGLAIIGFAEAFRDLKPELLLVLGDRFEIFAAAAAATMARLPIAHLDGGELTEGAIDDAFRHCLTKMSHLHLTTTEVYRQRVIQLGEAPERVFCVGSTAIDNILSLRSMSRSELEADLQISLKPKNLLITYYPETLSKDSVEGQFSELLAAMDDLEDTLLIFTKPAAETGSRAINRMIDEYVERHTDKAVGYVSLGQRRYLSLLRYVDAVAGNSSSGLSEAPSFRTINIGTRQQGRVKAKSVIECSPTRKSIMQAVERVYSPEFRTILQTVKNPYGDGGATERIVGILKGAPLDGIIHKRFHDLVSAPPIPSH
jgi:GDP/UDP-N,N'-diacetylbacillosamine 2-epimerase (hydrolysing)